jgi:uncharacterized protein (DUF983 family)
VTALSDERNIAAALLRALGLRCPVCGLSSVFRLPFKVRHHCPACGALFQREEGFFVGALMINVVTTEGAVLVAYAVFLLALGGRDSLVLPLLFAVALLFPFAFYHHAWSLWLAADHLIERLPKHTPGR